MDIQTAPKRHHSGGGGGREDCWSESGTETLIEAWGDRYLRLNRGNLRQKDWKEVADAVNANRTGGKLPRTDIQCKNRIDTLKKKYKLEKSKPSPSKWPFFYRLEHLIGNVGGTNSKKKSVRPPSVVMKSRPVFHPRNPSPNPNPNPSPSTNVVVYSGGSSRGINSSGSKTSEESGEGEDDRLDCVDFSEESACKELAKAILRFGEVYERIESSKQQQIMELEKQRMEFTKELEFQRMNMFMETQLELEKMKRSASKAAPNAGKKL